MSHKYFLFALLTLFPSFGHSQDQGYYTNVSTMPMFPGGIEAYFEYLKKHLKYPAEAFKKQKEGRVELSMVVDTMGKISQITVIKGIGYGCNEEAVRILQSMPNWTPGNNYGKKVNVLLNLPIEFKIDAYYNRYFINGTLIYRDERVLPVWKDTSTLQTYLSRQYSTFKKSGTTLQTYAFDLNIKIDTIGKVMDVLYTKSSPSEYMEIKEVFEWLTQQLKNMPSGYWKPAEAEGEKVHATYFTHIDL